MFNMKQIGKKITELRKKNNMTQMELADMLGISFQAVSNWERGNTMPDVSKLPELASIFHISIDELLNGKASLIESVIEGTVDTYIEEGKLTEDEVSDVLPLLKPTQAKDILEKTNVSSFENISTFLPHLDADFIAELATNAFENGNTIDHFLPYLDEDDVAKIANLAFEKELPIDNFLPFMDENDITKIANLAFEKELPIDNFLPFMDEFEIAKIANLAFEKGLPIDNFLPFMDEFEIAKIANLAFEKKLPVDNFLPFMDEDDITQLALKALKKK